MLYMQPTMVSSSYGSFFSTCVQTRRTWLLATGVWATPCRSWTAQTCSLARVYACMDGLHALAKQLARSLRAFHTWTADSAAQTSARRPLKHSQRHKQPQDRMQPSRSHVGSVPGCWLRDLKWKCPTGSKKWLRRCLGASEDRLPKL
jgi:hypothetical protein